MSKYRMDIFKPGRRLGHFGPLLWRRRDIYAADDAAAKAAGSCPAGVSCDRRALVIAKRAGMPPR